MIHERLIVSVTIGLFLVFIGILGLTYDFSEITANAVRTDCEGGSPCFQPEASFYAKKYKEAGSGKPEQHAYDLAQKGAEQYRDFLRTDTLEYLDRYFVLRSDDVLTVSGNSVRFLKSHHTPFAPQSTMALSGYEDKRALISVVYNFGLRQRHQEHEFVPSKVRVINGLSIVIDGVVDHYGHSDDMVILGFPGLPSSAQIDFHPALSVDEEVIVNGHSFQVSSYVKPLLASGKDYSYVLVLVNGKEVKLTPFVPTDLGGVVVALGDIYPFRDMYHFTFLDVQSVRYTGDDSLIY